MKKIIYILLLVFLITGCKKESIEKVYLTSTYYNKGEFIEVNDLSNLDNDTYLLFTYNNYCNFNVSCEDIFMSFMTKYNIDILKIPFDKFKNTIYYNEVKYAPSVILIKNNKVITYLDASKDEDIEKYQNEKAFASWIGKFIYLKEE